jgi:predicted ATPase/class 3 adenylate cyclase
VNETIRVVEGLPTGTVTFLFTDVVGSTRLWQEYPEAMRDVLARHDEVLRDAVDQRDGQVVKTTGDGLHAVFGTAPDALAAALDAQRTLLAEEWVLPEGLWVRMGLHTGEAQVRKGDYYGTAVNRAARVMSTAHGGQVLVSLATAELVRDAGLDGVELLDLGEHALRDLARPEHLFQLGAPGLLGEFPPLRTLHPFPGNLPVQVTSFVGRDDDVERVSGLLVEARLVTLAGTGGVGKTRLAVQTAAELLPRFGAGAWLCELAAADDGDAMAQVVASALGCVQHPGLSLQASIVEYLKVRELLLVLDNCEHLLDEAGEFAEAVVQGCPQVTVLATSREALAVSGERVVRLRPLATPKAAGDAALLGIASVRLFRDRAGDAGAELDWDERQWAAVGEICRRVDGIPLAIELAAVRTASMNPLDIVDHLNERFRLLIGKRRGRIERHQTLRQTVEWSYQLLEVEERAVFDRLGAFAGSFDAAAAVAVASDDHLDAWTATDALASLVGKSMLGTDTGPDGAIRYTMLETLRQYAREQLDETGDTDRCRRALAGHLARFAHAAGHGVMGTDHVLWLARIRADIDNLRAVISWALHAADPASQDLGLAILAPLAWIAQNTTDLGLDPLATQAVPLAERADPELRVPILTLAAYHSWHQGDLDQARHLAELALEGGPVATLPNPVEPYVVLVGIEMGAGNHNRAFELIDEQRSLLKDMNDPIAAACLALYANLEAMAGHLDATLADSAHALHLAQQSGNEHFLAHALHTRAYALRLHDPEAALAAAEQFLDLYHRDGVARGNAPGTAALAASLRSRLGDDNGAFELLRDAVVIARDDGAAPEVATAFGFALQPLIRTGRPDVAATLIGALDHGVLAHLANWPGTADARTRTLRRIRKTLGDQQTDQLLEHGAAMPYDTILRYAIEHLTPPQP